MSLHSLYVDLNSYFASVEQQLRPELRGRPVGVLPVMADTTCCIDARRFGIRTGTPVWQARKLCKRIVFVQARPATYVDIHHRIVAAVESCTPVGDVLSIDEMAYELMGSDCEEANAIKLGRQIKQAIYDQVGEVLHSSVGIAPNRFLAKTASNMQKPDGLVEHSQVTRGLFDPADRHEPFNTVLDQINLRYGPNTLYFGGAHNSRGAAPMRIAFSHAPEFQVEKDG